MKHEKKPALSTTAVSAIASTFCDALSQNESTGSLLHTVCETAFKYLRGAPIDKSDRNTIVERIAKERDWKGKSVESRKSECNVILKAYALLPEALKLFKNRSDKCQWHDGVALARKINSGKAPKAAVTALLTHKQQPTNYMRRLAGALKTAWDNVPRKRAEIVKAAKLLGIEGEWVK